MTSARPLSRFELKKLKVQTSELEGMFKRANQNCILLLIWWWFNRKRISPEFWEAYEVEGSRDSLLESTSPISLWAERSSLSEYPQRLLAITSIGSVKQILFEDLFGYLESSAESSVELFVESSDNILRFLRFLMNY